eukprot:TRINITY_DN20126_c0_g1_i1.p1 TRINITY_DN20126_c0_g1~~TRINITY_DN20126_c0_g1_i1.p1  ORF type:complete len:734 (-),score=66.16 TRINITY_DN20126_c0_g1_i1:100-2250(-)
MVTRDSRIPTSTSARVIERTAVPYSHRLPEGMIWCIHIVVAVGMVGLNLLQIFSMKTIVDVKFDTMQYVIDRSNIWFGFVFLAIASMTSASICLGAIFCFAPAAGGSGVSENKAWLNGARETMGVFTWRNMIVRAIATTFSNASGFPVGREGPTVTMGSNFAFCTFEFASFNYAKLRLSALIDAQRTNITASDDEVLASVLQQDRFMRAKRYACVVGGAVGMTMIFDAPIGAIVYMFEEIGAMSWGATLTFMAFTATATCNVVMRFVMVFVGQDIKKWVIYSVDWDASVLQESTWDWTDLPVFLSIAAVVGPFSALHTALCLRVGELRQSFFSTSERQSLGRCIDGILFAAVCAIVVIIAAHFGGCEDRETNFDASEANLKLVRFTCADNQYNPVASLLVTTSEAAMKLLISRTPAGVHVFGFDDLIYAFVAYVSLNILLTGIPVPSGNFTGTMLIGGMYGRSVGNVVRYMYPGAGLAKPGVYAMMGSAAMLCGFKRVSLAVVLFIAECGNDWNLIPPLMMTVSVSYILNHSYLGRGYDDEQIRRKHLPFLESIPHGGLYGKVAKIFIDESRLSIPPTVPLERVEGLLSDNGDVYDIPVVGANNFCVGFMSPARLKAALAHVRTHRRNPELEVHINAGLGLIEHRSSQAESSDLCLDQLMDRSPFKIEEEMPAPRVVQLFAKMGLNTACVVSSRGEYRGVITRANVSRVVCELQEH